MFSAKAHRQVRVIQDSRRFSGAGTRRGSRIRTLEAELEEARRERDKAKAVISDPYASVSGYVADLLRDVDQHAASVRATADAEADRIRSEVLALRSSMLDDLRAIRDHLAGALKELEAALEVEPAAKAVVVLAEVGEGAPAGAQTPTVYTANGSPKGSDRGSLQRNLGK